jgi:hypothetical protein
MSTSTGHWYLTTGQHVESATATVGSGRDDYGVVETYGVGNGDGDGGGDGDGDGDGNGNNDDDNGNGNNNNDNADCGHWQG